MLSYLKQHFSNKILRKIYKFIYKLYFPKAYHHNRRYYGYYQTQRNTNNELKKIFFKNTLVVDNTKVIQPNLKTCMLVATGSSISKLNLKDFSKPNIDYIGINGAIALDHVQFKYFVIIDHNFILKRFDLVRKVLDNVETLFTTMRCLDLILQKVSIENINCQIKIIETITRNKIERIFLAEEYINTQQPYFYYHNNYGFSENIFYAVFDYFTVAYTALQIIYSLNYTTVYLAGLDMNNFHHPRFYEENENKQPTLLDKRLDDIFPAFDCAAAFLKQHNVTVFNLSLDSAITAFDKVEKLHI